MNFQSPPEMLQQKRMQLAQAMTGPQQGGNQFGNIQQIMQNMAMKQGMENKNLGNWGMQNDFGSAGMPVDQWMNMRGR